MHLTTDIIDQIKNTIKYDTNTQEYFNSIEYRIKYYNNNNKQKKQTVKNDTTDIDDRDLSSNIIGKCIAYGGMGRYTVNGCTPSGSYSSDFN